MGAFSIKKVLASKSTKYFIYIYIYIYIYISRDREISSIYGGFLKWRPNHPFKLDFP